MLKQKFRLLKDFKPELHRSLDYGTGEGFYTEYLSKKGIDSWGIEPSKQARDNYWKRTGKLLFEGLADLPENVTFHSISLWHVLEHIHSLRQTVQSLVDRLEKNGVLTIAVPNQNSIDLGIFGNSWAAWDVPRHLYHWNEDSLSLFMENMGLKKVYTGQLPLDPFYISIISAKYSGHSPISGLVTGLRSYLHGRANKSEGSTLLTVWIRK